MHAKVVTPGTTCFLAATSACMEFMTTPELLMLTFYTYQYVQSLDTLTKAARI